MRNHIKILAINKPVEMPFTGKKVVLTKSDIDLINGYWDQTIKSGKKFTKGDVFTISSIVETEKKLQVIVDLSDYAHYLATTACTDFVLKAPCRVMHTSVLIETLDNVLFMGEMNENTSAPKRIQCAGGGITRDDLMKDGTLDIDKNAKQELFEETGLNVNTSKHVSYFGFKYLKSGGKFDSIGAIYLVNLNLTAKELFILFDEHNAILKRRGEIPEFSRLHSVIKDRGAVENFITSYEYQLDEYLPPLLRIHSSIDKTLN